MEDQPVSRKQEIITVVAIVLIAVVVVGAVVVAKKKNSSEGAASTTGSQQSSTSSSASSSSSSSTSNASYKDGSYSATGSYDSPGGTEKITVSVTLKSGVVSETSATSGAIDPEGQEYQSQFISGYKQLVVGKNINSISLSRVSGSSLTSQGFNNALEQIKQHAAS
jgi:cytoskeletal protein RodZ